ncbi:hypothetical protein [Acetivibrio cellulolyticus]|uniref:hypothetical protein n=1 Tax=Acetivibrio cellulolyticus TaxID=35830 RepID=UPI0001E2C278|nr:hypothetical protein [Acetivibrio cellulolyticus]
MFNKFKNSLKKTIHVSFIDVETGNSFAVSDMKPDQLPESFEASTTMYIQNESWEVVEAIPVTSAEFTKSRELKLILRKVEIQTVDPKELLLSLPTISNELPSIQEGSTKLNKSVFEIHEDDWRQVDIMPVSKMDLIVDNLMAIKDIYEKRAIQNGDIIVFKELHIRAGLDTPFDKHRLELQAILSDFSVLSDFEGLSFKGVAGLIEGGFAVAIAEGLTLYGLQRSNLIASLSIHYTNRENFEKETVKMVEVFAKHSLCMVDWCRMDVFRDQ